MDVAGGHHVTDFELLYGVCDAVSASRRGSGTASAPRTLSCTGHFSFSKMETYLRAASLALASVLAPVNDCGARGRELERATRSVHVSGMSVGDAHRG